MVISLQKGQKVDLTKGNASLNRIMVGLGWDPIEQKSSKGGLFGGLFGGGGGSSSNFDCDASVIMLQNDKLVDKQDLIYFGKTTSNCNSVKHSGDNLTGEGEGDDETIMVELNAIPAKFNKLVFVVNIYDAHKRKQDFGMVRNAYIRVVNPSNNEELIRYNLSENYSGQTALITGELYRHNGDWKFGAVGSATMDKGLTEICARYQ